MYGKDEQFVSNRLPDDIQSELHINFTFNISFMSRKRMLEKGYHYQTSF